MWRQYAKFYERFYLTLLLCAVASAGQSFILLAVALLVRRVFDEAIPAKDILLLAWIGAAILLANLASEGMGFIVRQRILFVTKVVTERLRHELVARVLTLPRARFGEADAGRLHDCIVQGTERVDVMSSAFISLFLPALLAGLVLTCVLAYLNRFLFLAVAVTAPALLLLSRALGRSLRRRVKIFHESFENFGRGTLFLIQMIDLIRLQSAGRFEAEQQRRNIAELRLQSSAVVRQQSLYVAVHNGIAVLGVVVVLVAGGWAIAGGRMTLGDLLSFYVVLALLRSQLSTVSSVLPQLVGGRESLQSLFAFLNSGEADPYSGSRRINFTGRVALEFVSFAYEEREVLRDVSMTIEPHGVTAIAGANGAGKTTVANLILGFYRPQRGRLLADGQPFDELDLADLRSRIAVVPQDPVVFFGTVAENIAYGSPQSSEAEIVWAAKLALAHDFICRLSDGYDTQVGERGALLSGGQRQLLAIARALLRRPTLLILDEMTNHLDEETIGSLLENLNGMERRPATLVISHDKNIVGIASRVYSLSEGRLTLSEVAHATVA